MIFYIILFLIILAIIIWGGVTRWRFVSKDLERFSISDFSKVKGNFYADLFDPSTMHDLNHRPPCEDCAVKRLLLWIFAATCSLKCTYILSPNFKNQKIINFLKKIWKNNLFKF